MQAKPIVKTEEKKKRPNLILFLILALPGVALLLWGLVEFAKELGFNLGSLMVEGTIVATAPYTGYTRGSPRYLVTPVVEYKVGDKSYQAKGTFYTFPNEVKIGNTVNVWYNPNDPSEARIENYRTDYANVELLILLGIAEIGFVILAYLFIILFRKPQTVALEAKKRLRSRP